MNSLRWILSLCILLASTSAVAASPDKPVNVVYGTDDPAIDVPAVQSAVDQGGTVVLRGTFDFGTEPGNHIIVPGRSYPEQDRKGLSTVFIYQKDVTIVGETGLNGEPQTIIKNGMPAFWIGWDGEVLREQPSGIYGIDFGIEILPVDADGRVSYRDTGPESGYNGPQTRYARAFQDVSARIEKLNFDSPKHYGIKATAGRDVFIIGNVFRDVQFGGLIHLNTFAGATHLAVGFGPVGLFYAPFVYPTITGEFVAERNVVDDVGTEDINTHFGECYGMVALFTTADAIRLERNKVRNVGRRPEGTGSDAFAAGVLLSDNYAAPPLVTGNSVDNSSYLGIWDLAGAAPSPGPNIEKNVVTNAEIGILSQSSIGPRPSVLIERNSISQDGLLGSGQSCVVADQSSEAVIALNSCEGDYLSSVFVLAGVSDSNLLQNRVFKASTPPGVPTYYLDAASIGNLVVGTSGTFVDDGTDNEILIRGAPVD